MRIGIANINPETGIAYGYISANVLDSDLVCELMNEGTDETAKAMWAEYVSDLARRIKEADESLTDEEAREQAEEAADNDAQSFWDGYECCEPEIHGEKEGVKYRTSYLGGALNFFIFFSPVVTNCARLASPCIPNAGILDELDGTVTSYDVPADWRYQAEPVEIPDVWFHPFPGSQLV
jgi:hypothetical protein